MPTMNGSETTSTENGRSTSDDVNFDIDTKAKNAAEWVKLGHNWAKTNLAHRGIMLEKIVQDDAFVKAARRYAITNDPKEFDAEKQKEEEMAVSIGNEYHYHQESNPPVTPVTPVPQPPQDHSLRNALILAASTLGGLGGGGWLIANALKPDGEKPVTPIVQPNDPNYRIESVVKPGFGVPTYPETGAK